MMLWMTKTDFIFQFVKKILYNKIELLYIKIKATFEKVFNEKLLKIAHGSQNLIIIQVFEFI